MKTMATRLGHPQVRPSEVSVNRPHLFPSLFNSSKDTNGPPTACRFAPARPAPAAGVSSDSPHDSFGELTAMSGLEVTSSLSNLSQIGESGSGQKANGVSIKIDAKHNTTREAPARGPRRTARPYKANATRPIIVTRIADQITAIPNSFIGFAPSKSPPGRRVPALSAFAVPPNEPVTAPASHERHARSPRRAAGSKHPHRSAPAGNETGVQGWSAPQSPFRGGFEPSWQWLCKLL